MTNSDHTLNVLYATQPADVAAWYIAVIKAFQRLGVYRHGQDIPGPELARELFEAYREAGYAPEQVPESLFSQAEIPITDN